jgi:hypothetical protein
MKETRQTYSLRFSRKNWKLITERAKALFGLNKQGQVQRAKYIEYLVLNDGFMAAGKQETK